MYCADAEVWHYHAMTLRSFTRQHYRYGRGAWTFHAARAQRNGADRELEPLAFYLGLVWYPWRRLRGWRAAAIMALLGWAQVVNAYGYFEGWRTRTASR